MLEYCKIVHSQKLNYDGVPISRENLCIPPFPMEKTRSYFCSPELSYGLASNLTTLVDQALFNYVDDDAVVVAYMSHKTMIRFTLHFWFRFGPCNS